MNPHSVPRLDGDDDPDTGYFRREEFKPFDQQTYQREILDASSIPLVAIQPLPITSLD